MKKFNMFYQPGKLEKQSGNFKRPQNDEKV